MKKANKIIQLELNEISKEVIQQLIAKGELPNFARIDKEWSYLSTSSEQEYDKLEPWIQWVTAHTGKSFSEHGIFRLSDAENLEHPQIWETLSASNVESGIIGSMNVTRGATKGGVFFPDPWSKENYAYPEEIKPLWDLISKQVQGHATGKTSVDDLIKGLKSLLKYKIPPSLYAQIASQIVAQKINPKKKWRLAGYFDKLLFEIFSTTQKSTDFRYYTLFLNAVAHYQHHYWRNFDRSPFSPDINYDDIGKDDDPITFGYKIYDEVIGQVLKQKSDDTLVLIVSGLTQVPYTEKEVQGGMNYYRLNDHQGFANLLGLERDAGFTVFPLMSRDWQIGYDGEDQRQLILARLSGLTVRKQPLFKVKENTPGYIFIETAYTRQTTAEDRIVDGAGKDIAGFNDVFTNIAIKSGHHSGTGHLWASDPDFGKKFPDREMPLTSLYDLTLSNLGV